MARDATPRHLLCTQLPQAQGAKLQVVPARKGGGGGDDGRGQPAWICAGNSLQDFAALAFVEVVGQVLVGKHAVKPRHNVFHLRRVTCDG